MGGGDGSSCESGIWCRYVDGGNVETTFWFGHSVHLITEKQGLWDYISKVI